MQNTFLRMIRPSRNGHELIRIGNNGDGGYLLPNDLQGINGCVSIGSNREWSFEKNLFEYASISSYILDLEEKKPVDLDKNHFYYSGLLGVKNTSQFVTLEKFLNEFNLNSVGELILKLDIESAEYEVLLDVSMDTLKKFRILIVEFHYFSKSLNPDLLLSRFIKIFTKLGTVFDIVHFHPNNCEEVFRLNKSWMPRVVEITFHRKERAKIPLVWAQLPHVLDQPNIPSKPEINAVWNYN
jgi:FkbM family methyltransferase